MTPKYFFKPPLHRVDMWMLVGNSRRGRFYRGLLARARGVRERCRRSLRGLARDQSRDSLLLLVGCRRRHSPRAFTRGWSLQPYDLLARRRSLARFLNFRFLDRRIRDRNFVSG